jgi:hypothetical protein
VITVAIWHSVAPGAEGRHTAMLDGCQPGDPMVAVFTCRAGPAGRSAGQIAAGASGTFSDHPRDPGGAGLACRYCRRRLRSASFPGWWACCLRSCCVHGSAVWLRPRIRAGMPRAGVTRD